ncbi:uncharacterized protein [Elaeis guineensis]|uniref:uncharacterized protein isoform X2 n=1 Tax=Elaeis guineensis var. tenera TaxID=51953 RepID=UPI003C6CEC8D
MASTSIRSINRIAQSFRSSFAAKSKTAARCFSGGSAATPPPTRRFSSFSRLPVELGCCGGSLLPLHSAVAAARLTSRLSLTSRSCRALSQGSNEATYVFGLYRYSYGANVDKKHLRSPRNVNLLLLERNKMGA